MEVNRNQFFMIGLVLLFLGIELRLVDSVVLTSEFSAFVAQRTGQMASTGNPMQLVGGGASQVPLQTFYPPDFLGWSLLSVGSVLILHALAMKKPGG